MIKGRVLRHPSKLYQGFKRLFSAIQDTPVRKTHPTDLIAKKRDRAIFAVAYRHGLRASEVGMLQRTDLDLKAARITINRVKGSMAGVYPMAPDTVKLIRSYLNNRNDGSPLLA